MRDDAARTGQFGPAVYAGWRDSSLGEITEALEHRLIFRLIGPLNGKRILDAGCGDGTLALAASREGAAWVCGCDLDPRMVGKARASAMKDGVTLDLAVARLQALPFRDNAFDAVTCITVLAFIPDPAAALGELARVLAPGGRLVVGDLGKWSVWAARRRIRGWLGAKIWRAARFRTARELTALITDAGLTIGTVEGAIFYPPVTRLARWVAPVDAGLGQLTTAGAAFVAVQATKTAP